MQKNKQAKKLSFYQHFWGTKVPLPPWVGGTKVCSQHLGHMTKMAAMPIYGKNPSKIFSGTVGPFSMKLGM